ncbi:AmmeMemoRadiSam system protein B, partial [Singulisphaera rosea]
MATLDRPRLRPLSARRLEHKGIVYVALEDPLGVFTDPVLIPIESFERVVRFFDGKTSLSEIQARIVRETGEWIGLKTLEDLVTRLDVAMALDGPTFDAFRAAYRECRLR